MNSLFTFLFQKFYVEIANFRSGLGNMPGESEA